MEISTTSDIEAFLRPCFIAGGRQPPRNSIESVSSLIDTGRAHIMCAEGQIVGAAGAFTHKLAVPGGVVPAAAVFAVGVLPSHRRRGILTMLQEAQLADIHRRGEPVAYLWTTEGGIYGRFGYGMASQAGRITLETTSAKLRGATERCGNVRLIEPNEAYEVIAPIYSRIWQKHPGMAFRSENWWRFKRLTIPDLFHVVWEDSAYALYLVNMDLSSERFTGEIEVVEALAESAEGNRELWRYLISIDLIETVSAGCLPIDHPLNLMLEDSRKMNLRVRDGVWLRIVDVEAALRARALGNGSIRIEVIDTLLSHNQGTWQVGAEGVFRAVTSPDLVIQIADLGSVYLGGFSFSDLARVGRVHEHTLGAIRRADCIFSWDCKPWCPESF